MKKTVQFFAVILVVMMLITAVAVPISAETVYEHDGVLFEKLDNGFVSVFGCNDDVTALVIPNSVSEGYVLTIGDLAFQNNTVITSLDLSKTRHLTTIGTMSFNGCTSLQGNLYVPNLVNTVKSGAFQGCTSLESVSFSARASLIPEICFNRCSSLSSVTLSESVEKIDKLAFANCPNLSKVVIPDTVTDIHYTAFSNDANLVIYCNSGSYAHQFASDRGYDFVLLDVQPPTEPDTQEPTHQTIDVTFILGDADGDGFITILDATKVQRVLADLDDDTDGMITLRAAVDGDVLNIMHATKIQRYLAEFEVAEPIGEEVTRQIEI